jgi:methyl-accepting chemotaxis protein
LTVVLFFVLRRPFPWWPPFGWPLLGLIGLLLLVYSSIRDADTNKRVLLALFQEQFDPGLVRDKALRLDVENALEYQRRIEDEIQRQRPGLIRERLEATANQITEWLYNIYQLAQRVDAYRADDLLAREREILPKELERLTAQRKVESNPTVQQQLDAVIDGKAKHWQALRDLDARMKQAALQLEQSLTALATVYSQVQLIDAQSVGSGQAERLQSDIREQVERLNDLVSSINEVYDYSSKGLGD